jgi:hypothetical protein
MVTVSFWRKELKSVLTAKNSKTSKVLRLRYQLHQNASHPLEDSVPLILLKPHEQDSSVMPDICSLQKRASPAKKLIITNSSTIHHYHDKLPLYHTRYFNCKCLEKYRLYDNLRIFRTFTIAEKDIRILILTRMCDNGTYTGTSR